MNKGLSNKLVIQFTYITPRPVVSNPQVLVGNRLAGFAEGSFYTL